MHKYATLCKLSIFGVIIKNSSQFFEVLYTFLVNTPCKLLSFDPLPELNKIHFAVEACIARQSLHLKYIYEAIPDHFPELILTPSRDHQTSPEPQRLDHLWEHTCFEAFLSSKKSDEYWELNISPFGDWNLYHFKGYRKALGREARIPSLSHFKSDFLQTQTVRSLEVTIDLKSLPLTSELSLGLTAVLEFQYPVGKTYWALKHAGQKPDFHLQESFVLKLKSKT